MRLDEGIVIIKRQINIAEPGEMPEYRWDEIWKSYYAEKTVGYNRYYIAHAQDDRIDRLIEVQHNRNISTAIDRAEIDGIPYRIVTVQQVTNEDGLPMTDLTLERIEGLE